MFKYTPCGTCSKLIEFEVDENNKLHSVQFTGGCKGNTQGVCKLVEGRDIDEVASLLSGVQCRNGTSCPDLPKRLQNTSKALNKEYYYIANAERENRATL